MDRFAYLKAGLAAVLVLVGMKMSSADWVKVSPAASLAMIAFILGAAVALSLLRRGGKGAGAAATSAAPSPPSRSRASGCP